MRAFHQCSYCRQHSSTFWGALITRTGFRNLSHPGLVWNFTLLKPHPITKKFKNAIATPIGRVEPPAWPKHVSLRKQVTLWTTSAFVRWTHLLDITTIHSGSTIPFWIRETKNNILSIFHHRYNHYTQKISHLRENDRYKFNMTRDTTLN